MKHYNIIIAFLVVCTLLVAGCTQSEEFTDLEKEIIEMSCKQMGIAYDPQSQIEMIMTSQETPSWSDYECREYVLQVDNHVMQLGVQLNDEGIHLIDVYYCNDVTL